MKKALFVYLLFAGYVASAQSDVCDYAYMHNNAVYVYSNADKQQYLVAANGEDPALSPDGMRLTYTATRANGDRYIVLYLLGPKKKIILNTHNGNCYGAVWSPDASMLAYNAFLGGHWEIGVINTDNTGAHLLGKNSNNVYSPVWPVEGKKVMVQDGKNLEYIDMQGKVFPIIAISKLEGGLPELKGMAGSSSSDRFVLTGHGNKIVFSSSTNEAGTSTGPPGAVFVYDMATGKTVRLSKKGYDAGDVVLRGILVWFNTSKFGGKTVSIAQVDLDGNNYKILFPGCMDISVKL